MNVFLSPNARVSIFLTVFGIDFYWLDFRFVLWITDIIRCTQMEPV